jgi:prolyl oligopeptidase
LKNAITRLEVRELDGRLVREVPPRIGAFGWLTGTPDADDVYYAFSSYDRPPEIRRMSVHDGTESVWYRQDVPADLPRLVVEQVFYSSKDGTRDPMTIFRRVDAKRDHGAPLLLWGYGAANNVPQPNWSPLVVPWVERGGIYAAANLRGGGEYGEEWHRAGSLRNKQNTFDDYIAAAEYLVREGYTSAQRLAARGSSWGGLLVTAVLTQRPELFRAVIADVPQTDMIRFPRTGLGTTPLAEFGDPADPDDFRILFGYSPYHHVTAGTRYPAVFLRAAEADERVDALHARKLAAALQAASTGGDVLLRIDWGGSHKGTGLVSSEADKRADECAFVLAAMGLVR